MRTDLILTIIFGSIVSLVLISFFLGATFVTTAAAQTISPEEGKAKVSSGALLLDVRTPEEFGMGHVEGAINIPHDQIKDRLAELGKDKNRAIVAYCQAGRRSGFAQKTLQENGYKNVFNGGGYPDWKK